MDQITKDILESYVIIGAFALACCYGYYRAFFKKDLDDINKDTEARTKKSTIERKITE